MDEKLTRKSQEALSTAVRRATALGNPHVDAAHLLVALIEQSEGTAAPLLRIQPMSSGRPRRCWADCRARLAIRSARLTCPGNSPPP